MPSHNLEKALVHVNIYIIEIRFSLPSSRFCLKSASPALMSSEADNLAL